jgi:hypothetical protein
MSHRSLKLSTLSLALVFNTPVLAASAAPEDSPAPARQAPTSGTPTSTAYLWGSVVKVYPLVSVSHDRYLQKGNAIGQFINEANPWSLALHKQVQGLNFFYGKPTGYEADAFFVAKTDGDYSFSVTVEAPPVHTFASPERLAGFHRGAVSCHYRLIIDDKTLIDFRTESQAREVSDEDRRCGLTSYATGEIQLTKGLHPVRQWFACSGERQLNPNITTYSYPKGCPKAGQRLVVDSFPFDEVSVTLRVRHPEENTQAIVTSSELVHEKVTPTASNP